jgi:serine kinase of HPr protein (carbohydrate metabolism regulator)
LIRGPSGSGKSQLALDLIEAAACGRLLFARLVADDRVHLQAQGRRLVAHPAATLAGLIEVRGVGILRMAFESSAVVGLVVDLDAADSERLPGPEHMQVELEGVRLARLAVAPGVVALPLLLTHITYLPDRFSGCEAGILAPGPENP